MRALKTVNLKEIEREILGPKDEPKVKQRKASVKSTVLLGKELI